MDKRLLCQPSDLCPCRFVFTCLQPGLHHWKRLLRDPQPWTCLRGKYTGFIVQCLVRHAGWLIFFYVKIIEPDTFRKPNLNTMLAIGQVEFTDHLARQTRQMPGYVN